MCIYIYIYILHKYLSIRQNVWMIRTEASFPLKYPGSRCHLSPCHLPQSLVSLAEAHASSNLFTCGCLQPEKPSTAKPRTKRPWTKIL